ncbi:MAG: hypothetical protein L6Q71_10620 [Planctomycetes bacterium]|nr:hypothetical protein [Planctomycetota bacterium]NUQ34734.1 hypothetical protein [Planctomycetaceae bacterium]
MIRTIAIFLAFLMVACCTTTTPPLQGKPASREQAAREVCDTLSTSATKTKDAAYAESILTWKTQVHDPNMRWLERQLDLRTVESVNAPSASQTGWTVTLETGGEDVEFTVETQKQAQQLQFNLMYLVSLARRE